MAGLKEADARERLDSIMAMGVADPEQVREVLAMFPVLAQFYAGKLNEDGKLVPSSANPAEFCAVMRVWAAVVRLQRSESKKIVPAIEQAPASEPDDAEEQEVKAPTQRFRLVG